VRAAFAHAIPGALTDGQAAPLLCAGAIGWRSLKLTGLRDGEPLGLTGFGASAHLVLQLARQRYPHSPVYVTARDPVEREFALALGATWAGAGAERMPSPPAAIIDTTPAWAPVIDALGQLAPGGRLVINAIRKGADKSALLELDYARHLWMEREVKSVANVTRADVRAVLDEANRTGIRPTVEEVQLGAANDALDALRSGGMVLGARVLRVAS
jgi:propanol-preferring alcohol dehydrogenase